jgi:hypothetical protein
MKSKVRTNPNHGGGRKEKQMNAVTAEMIVGHCNYQGIGFNFAVDTSGLTAIGSRINLHSPGMLICIGEK